MPKPTNGDLPTYPERHRNSLNKGMTKTAKSTVQETLKLHQAILDSANYSIIATTIDGTICAFNTTAERWLGYAASEIIGICSPERFHDLSEVQQRAIALTEELGKPIPVGFEVFVAKAKLGQIEEIEWTYIRKDGSRFPVMLSISALRNDDNQISGFLGIATDLSSRKFAESKLQTTLHELEFQKFALDQAAIVAVTDLNGAITYANSKFCEISGYSQNELIGKNHRFINSEYHSPEFFANL
jgi:PAS domain S-box-containing protein